MEPFAIWHRQYCNQGTLLVSRVAQQNSGWPGTAPADRGKSQHFNSKSSGSIQVSFTSFIASSILSFKPLLHFFYFIFFHVSHAAPKHRPPHFLIKKWGLELLPSQTGYSSYKVLPRGLFLLAEIATRCLFSTAETPLQIQRGFPEVSNVRSAGTTLPTSSPGLQLSQGEEAVYQHTRQRVCRAAALLNHTAPQLAQLSYRGNSTFTVPNNLQTNTPTCSSPLGGFTLQAERFQTAHSRVSLWGR